LYALAAEQLGLYVPVALLLLHCELEPSLMKDVVSLFCLLFFFLLASSPLRSLRAPPLKLVEDFRAVKAEMVRRAPLQELPLFYAYKFTTTMMLLAAGLATASYGQHSALLVVLGATLTGLFWQQTGWLAHDFCHNQVRQETAPLLGDSTPPPAACPKQLSLRTLNLLSLPEPPPACSWGLNVTVSEVPWGHCKQHALNCFCLFWVWLWGWAMGLCCGAGLGVGSGVQGAVAEPRNRWLLPGETWRWGSARTGGRSKHNKHHAAPNECDEVYNAVDPDIDTLPFPGVV